MRTSHPLTRALLFFAMVIHAAGIWAQTSSHHHQTTATAISMRSWKEAVPTTPLQNGKQAGANGVRTALFQEADAAMQLAKEAEAALLAPSAFEAGLISYQQAEKEFQRGGKLEDLRAHLQRATGLFRQARSAAQWASLNLSAALTARDDARHAQAPRYASPSWQKAETKMKKTARTLEEGNLKSALKQAPALEQEYRRAELEAVQNRPQADSYQTFNAREEQRESIEQLQQDLASGEARVHALQERVTALEKKVEGKNGAAGNHRVAPAKVQTDAALQACFSKNEAVVFSKNGDTVVRLFELDFFANTAQLSAASTRLLWRVGEVLKKFPFAGVAVAGHVFSERNQEANLKLSRERAEAVKRYLLENRLAGQALVAIGFGDTAPIPPEELFEGPVKNERIDVIIGFAPSQVSSLYWR